MGLHSNVKYTHLKNNHIYIHNSDEFTMSTVYLIYYNI